MVAAGEFQRYLSQMIIRFYSSHKTGYPAKIENLLIENFADQVVEIYRDPNRIVHSYKIPGGDRAAALLVMEGPDELRFFADRGDLLCESASRIIVVSTMQTKNALRMVHHLRPSFIHRKGDNLETLAAVLNKVIYEEERTSDV